MISFFPIYHRRFSLAIEPLLVINCALQCTLPELVIVRLIAAKVLKVYQLSTVFPLFFVGRG